MMFSSLFLLSIHIHKGFHATVVLRATVILRFSNYCLGGDPHSISPSDTKNRVLVGDDNFDSHSSSTSTTTSPTYHYAVVETIQIVWTLNCEHGVIGAWPLSLVRNDHDDNSGDSTSTRMATTTSPSIMQRFEIANYDMVQFGPEQLVAKLPCRLEEGNGTVHVECPPLQLVLMDKRCHPRTAEEDESNEKSD